MNKVMENNESVKHLLHKEEVLSDVADLFKMFGDFTRIKIIYALTECEMCVYDLADTLEMTQSAISHQLRLLKNAKLVKCRREGKMMYYSLDDDHVKLIFDTGYKHILHSR